jgi:hypothetical protein
MKNAIVAIANHEPSQRLRASSAGGDGQSSSWAKPKAATRSGRSRSSGSEGKPYRGFLVTAAILNRAAKITSYQAIG